MKDLGNYVCDGQMDIFDYMQQLEETVTETVTPEEEYKESVSEPIAAVSEPKKCCGVTPWLKKSRCVQWDSNKPRHYMMAYICPKCGKIAVDNTGWPRYGYGTFEDAAGQALEIWNDKNAVFEIKDYNNPKNNNYIQILYGEEDEWEKLYGQKYDDYKRPIIQKANEAYRKRKANEEKM